MREEEGETGGWETPKRGDCRIPAAIRCPPPPRKKKRCPTAAGALGKRRGPPRNGQFQKLRNHQRPCYPCRLARRIRVLFLPLNRSRRKESRVSQGFVDLRGDPPSAATKPSSSSPASSRFLPLPFHSIETLGGFTFGVVCRQGGGVWDGKNGVGMASIGVTRPEPVMKSIMLVVRARRSTDLLSL
ncbi:hypothetical protein B296_00003104 [Ensete ventricosum]|uniref:Uncharacterized protein n=1 Tax=Ensete ventricosum TaxID=4639 RepID=A0A427A5U0_ENSVE|nr:hypothetical protein B296_00003104 [Ensete ventricosum]